MRSASSGLNSQRALRQLPRAFIAFARVQRPVVRFDTDDVPKSRPCHRHSLGRV